MASLPLVLYSKFYFTVSIVLCNYEHPTSQSTPRRFLLQPFSILFLNCSIEFKCCNHGFKYPTEMVICFLPSKTESRLHLIFLSLVMNTVVNPSLGPPALKLGLKFIPLHFIIRINHLITAHSIYIVSVTLNKV